MSIHPIHYVFLMGERPRQNVNHIIPAEELRRCGLLRLGFLPQSIEHLVVGYRFYNSLLLSGEYFGYAAMFMYNDSLVRLSEYKSNVFQGNPVVYIIAANEVTDLDYIASELRKLHDTNSFYLIPLCCEPWFNFGNAFTTVTDIINPLKAIAPKYVDFQLLKDPYDVPDGVELLDNGFSFNPTRVNTLIGHSMLGDWDFPVIERTPEQKAADSKIAIEEHDTFNRQNQVVEQIRILNALENATLRLSNAKDGQIKAPLVINVPFTASDYRKLFKSFKTTDYAIQQEAVNYVLSQTTDKNYTVTCTLGTDSNLNPKIVAAAFQTLYASRAEFLDGLTLLHCSFRHSPSLRFPFLGIEINRELSFVAPLVSDRLINAKRSAGENGSVETVMMQLGRKIAENALSVEAREMFEKMDRQIVAISDLPVEWISINDVPLGFSHDVCRIPELPYGSGMMHYVINAVDHYQVPEDILQHTLVIYGADDDGFIYYQDRCEELKMRLGFQTRRCANATDFYTAIREIDPQFLIVDCHGNYDPETHQTFLMIGNDKIYPQDIVDNKINVKLVFLSTCNTAPTYNAVNTIANGFFQAGALAVTSSYLPLEVNDASTIYLRLLHQLSIASTTKIHPNWLSFISHILRTSYIHAAFSEFYQEQSKEKVLKVDDFARKAVTRYTSESMFFRRRRQIYKELKTGFVADGVNVRVSNKVPHYLMYSTIGRADLIPFKSYQPNLKNIFGHAQ